MDFTIPAKALSLLSPVKNSANPDLSLKIGQQVDAKVLNISVENNVIELQLGNMAVKAAADPPLSPHNSFSQALQNLTKGEQLTLLVSKLLPNPELSLELAAPTQKQSQLPLSEKDKLINSAVNEIKSKPLVLKLLLPTTVQPSTVKSTTSDKSSFFEKGQQFTARIVSKENNSLILEFLPDQKKNNLDNTNSIKQSHLSVPLEKISQSQSSMTKVALPQLKNGQFIALEVTKSGNQPQFKILETQKPAFSVTSEKTLTDTIKRFLPIQQTPASFIDQLGKNLPSLVVDKTVPEALKQIAQQIFHQLPKKTTLTTPPGLKQSINNSGLFLESKLLLSEKESTIKTEPDFKANILKFIQALKQQAPPMLPSELTNTEHEPLNLRKLQNNAESSIAKMVLDQISSLPKEESSKQVWNIELPYLGDQKTIENISFQIEQEKNKQEQPEKNNWTVNITLNPPNLGELYCKISCINGSINTHFWSHSSETNHLVSQNLDFLKSRLEASGLKTGQIKAHDSPHKSFKKAVKYPNKLIDEKI